MKLIRAKLMSLVSKIHEHSKRSLFSASNSNSTFNFKKVKKGNLVAEEALWFMGALRKNQ